MPQPLKSEYFFNNLPRARTKFILFDDLLSIIKKQKVVIKKKEKLKEKSKDKLALHLLLKQLEIFKLKEYILLAGFMLGGALLRIPMQAVPSAEPITFFAMLAGWLFGPEGSCVWTSKSTPKSSPNSTSKSTLN